MGVDSSSVPFEKKPFFAWLKKTNWIGFLIVACLLLVLTYTLGESYWVRISPPLFLVTLLAVMIGWLLSKTRWRMGWSVGYSLLLSLSFGTQYVGKIIPSLRGVQLDQWLEITNWQIFLFLERTNQWLQSIQNQRIIYDEGFWAIVLIALVWGSTSWLVFCLNRGKNVWMAILPLIGSIGLSIQNDRNEVIFLLVALFLGILLVTNSHYSRSEKNWQWRRIDFPEQLWVDWYVAALVIAFVVLFAANLAPIITTPEGWQAIRNWVEEMKEPESSSENYDGTGYVFRPPETRDEKLLLLQPLDLSRVGAPLPQMEGTVMWVRTGDVTPRPWRMAIYDTYTGSGWLETDLDEQGAFQVEEPPRRGRKAFYQRFTLFRAGDGRLFAAGEPVQSLNENVRLVPLINDDSQIVTGYASHYEVISWVPDLSAEMLKTATGEIPALIQTQYLELPEKLPPRVRNLAARLVEGQDTLFERVIKVQEYVRQAVPYDLESPLPASNQDVVDYFLFEANSGFCTYYASAMAVLLRIEGIPTRVVTGYAPGVFVPEQGNFEVTGDLAHAWVEVYFPEYGWIPFEPTPSQAVPAYSMMNAEILESDLNLSSSNPQGKGWIWLQILLIMGIGLGVVFLIWILVGFVRSHMQEKKLALHPAARLYRRLRMQLANAGISAGPNVTPREFLVMAEEPLSKFPKIQGMLVFGTDLFEQSFFSMNEPDEDQMIELKRKNNNLFLEKTHLKFAYLWKNYFTTKPGRK